MIGQWSSFISYKASSAYEGVKDFASVSADVVVDTTVGTVDFVSDLCREPSATSHKVWNGMTGRTTFNEAEELLHEITDKYDKAQFKYQKNIKIINKTLERKLSQINYHKRDIFDNHFTRFTNLANKLHNLNIKGKSFLEYFDDSITEVKHLKGVRKKEDLYTIDFNNLKFSEKFLGAVTLGIFTRKEAKKTLNKVKKEASRIDYEISKMDSQITDLKVVLESINNVEEYFELLIINYTNLLDRFEYGITSQIPKTILNGSTLEKGKLDFKLMPLIHIEEFQSLFNLSIVLKQMATMGYLTDKGIDKEDIESINNIKQKVDESQLLVA